MAMGEPQEAEGWRLRSSPGDELDLEAVCVLEVDGVVVGSPGEGVPVGEQQAPPALGGGGDQGVEVGSAASREGEVVEPGTAAVVVGAAESARLLKYSNSHPQRSAAAPRSATSSSMWCTSPAAEQA